MNQPILADTRLSTGQRKPTACKSILASTLTRIPEGYSQACLRGKRWGVCKTVLNDGRSVKLFAEELGGRDFVSCNFYRTSSGLVAKPCEMPLAKVEFFLSEATFEPPYPEV
jgi:hypothetical protein